MKIPYQLVKACSDDQRTAFMAHAIAVTPPIPRLQPSAINDDPAHVLSIACYGPSLADTYTQLRPPDDPYRPILSMSGATHFLAERGIIPTWHIDMDPREHKTRHLQPVIAGVKYLMASVCPPSTWDLLRQQHADVSLWHVRSNAATGDWVREHDPDSVYLWPGSSIGLAALHMGGILGYRHFEIHGMDGSLRGGAAGTSTAARHAGPHYGPSQAKHACTWDAGRVTYHTTKIMANSIAELLTQLDLYPMYCVFHGEGLTQALVREAARDNACCVDEIDRARRIRQSRPVFYAISAPPTSTPLSSTPPFWETLIDQLPKDAVPELIRFARQAESLRPRAHFNTGTIPLETALQLRALCHCYTPAVVCEIGTFIGTSTYALHAQRHLYTCDVMNDCLAPTDNIVTHPYTTSTLLFKTLAARQIPVDLFFFDGRLPPADLPLILSLSRPQTIYAFDDCTDLPGRNKGHANLALLRASLPNHVYIPPMPAFAGRSTLGVLVPMIPVGTAIARPLAA